MSKTVLLLKELLPLVEGGLDCYVNNDYVGYFYSADKKNTKIIW